MPVEIIAFGVLGWVPLALVVIASSVSAGRADRRTEALRNG
jgi:hypothetical protein